MKNDWQNYQGDHVLFRGVKQWWQVKLFSKNDKDVYTDVHEYPPMGSLGFSTYEITVRIPKEISITGHTINAIIFSYDHLDLPMFKRHAKRVAKALTAI